MRSFLSIMGVDARFYKDALRPVLARRQGADRECVHAALKLTHERVIDHTMALDPALFFEGIGHDIHSEVALPAGSMAGMSLVQMRVIRHLELRGCEGFDQLLRDQIVGPHGLRILVPRRTVNSCG